MITKELSFIIPTFNEEAHIGGVMDAIERSVDGRFLYEVIVIDNGSSDRTVDIAREKGAICLHGPGFTISSLRNLGASEATSDIFVFLDADVYLDKSWGERIRPVINRLRQESNIVTGSMYGISADNNWIESTWFAPRTTVQDINYINGGHLIIHKNQFLKVGGFDAGLETGEDYEFCARAKGVGTRIENNPELRVAHAGYPKTLRAFFIRERWHGRGDYKSLKTIASSKPAIISCVNLCMISTCSTGIILGIEPWSRFLYIYSLFLIIVSLSASIHRYRGKLNAHYVSVVFLYMVYFTARTVAIVDVALQFLTRRTTTS